LNETGTTRATKTNPFASTPEKAEAKCRCQGEVNVAAGEGDAVDGTLEKGAWREEELGGWG